MEGERRDSGDARQPLTGEAELGLTTGAVSLRLGVAPTTLRSWDQRYGIGPTGREQGRHRRWSPEDVAALEELCRLTADGVPVAEAARMVRQSAARAAQAVRRTGRTRARPGGAVPSARRGSGALRDASAAADAGAAPYAPPAPARGGRPRRDAPAGASGFVEPRGASREALRSGGGGQPVSPPVAEPRTPAPLVDDVGLGDPLADAPGAAEPAGTPSPADPRVLVRGIGRAAVRLDAPLVDSLLRRVVAQQGLTAAWDTVLRPALRAIGRTWAASGDDTGEKFVEAEHLLSWQISTVVRAHTPPVPVPADGMDERPVLLACAPGENHTLAAEVLTAVLAERGVPVRMFGAAVPVAALAAAVRRSGPRAVVLWSQRHPTADQEAVRRVRETGWGIRGARRHPAVLLAGPGWTGVRESDGLHRPRSLTQALDLLLPTGPFRSPRTPARTLTPDHATRH